MALLLALVLGAQYMVSRQRPDVTVTELELAGNPVDRYQAVGEKLGVVLVAHGFAANKELMRPWGYYLAQQGFDTYIFDQPGHGHSDRRLPGDVWTGTALGDNLRAMVDELVAGQQAAPGQIGLVGHSMGGLTVTQLALSDDRIRATVAISSAYRGEIPREKPQNLLSFAAERDPGFMVEAVTALARQSAGGAGELGKQYGSLRDGSARASYVEQGRNHITILYDAEAMERTGAWLRESVAARTGVLDGGRYGWTWIALGLTAALVFVAVCAAVLAPAYARRGARNQQRAKFLTALVMLAVAAFSAVLAVVYIRFPWPRIAVLDYLLPYYLVMAAVLLVLRLVWPREYGYQVASQDGSDPAAMLRGLGVFLGLAGAAGPIIHMNLSNFMLEPARILPLLVVAAGLWLYQVQEEALKRAVSADAGPGAGALAGLVGKLVVVLTWYGAAALPNPQTFLPLTIPVLVIIMGMLELFSYLMNRWHYPAAGAAVFSALVMAWCTVVTFPVV
jgi:pimeloyl-ACP methyl ester carboxylesterase